MGNECYLQLQQIISKFSYLHQFLDDSFIRKQCESGLKCYFLEYLVNKESRFKPCQYLPTLEKMLAELSSVTGYDRSKHLLKGADWDQYNEGLAQIDITLWFKRKSLLKEIEPRLPCTAGVGDILLTFLQQDIYCEVTSPESLQKLIESKKQNEAKKVQHLLKKQPWMSKQDAEHELKIERAVRNLLDKTKRQLPPNHPGILALETGKSMVFGFDVKKIAQKLFPSRPQVILIMLWTLERGSQMEEPPFWFVNPNSPFQDIGQELLNYLGQDNKAFDC